MTQIIVTLESGADGTLLQRMIENMKGVIRTSLRKMDINENRSQTDNWIKRMNDLSNSVDSSDIDMSDERTRYIMSK